MLLPSDGKSPGDEREALNGLLGFWVGAGKGNMIFVHHTGTAGGTGRNINAPLPTIDEAVGACTADNGDMIVVLQGHAETLSLITSLVCDIAGISIVGLGNGAQRPLLTFSALASTISITAADVSIQNIRLLGAFAGGITYGVTVAGTADGCKLRDLEFNETDNDNEWLTGIRVAANVDDMVIQGCRYFGLDGGSALKAISFAGGANRLRLLDNFLRGDFAAAAVELDGAQSLDMEILNNRVVNIDAAAGIGIAIDATSTGFVDGNMTVNLKDTVVGITGAGMYYGRNYYSNAVNKSCRLAPDEDA